MRNSKVHASCVEILRQLIQAGYTKEFTSQVLNTVITLQRGGDPRTLVNWKNNLVRLGFIKIRSSQSTIVYEFVLENVSELLNEMVVCGQKKLM